MEKKLAEVQEHVVIGSFCWALGDGDKHYELAWNWLSGPSEKGFMRAPAGFWSVHEGEIY